MREVLVDSWAWVALAARHDEHHADATAQHSRFRKEGVRYLTTDFILSEVATLLFRILTFEQASKFVSTVLRAIHDGEYSLVHVSPSQFQAAWTMRLMYQDKPDISFVDFTSMVVMQDAGINEVFTGDVHFRQVNRGFVLYPQ